MVKLGSILKVPEPKLRSGWIWLFRNERRFHSLNSIFQATWGNWPLGVQGLDFSPKPASQNSEESQRVSVLVGGNMRRVFLLPLPHPPAQQIPPPLLEPLCPSSLASRPVFQLYPVISCITIMKPSACFICNSDTAWVTLHWREPWLESHQFNWLENLRYWLEFWLVPKNIYTHCLVCPQVHFLCPNPLHLFSFVNVK